MEGAEQEIPPSEAAAQKEPSNTETTSAKEVKKTSSRESIKSQSSQKSKKGGDGSKKERPKSAESAGNKKTKGKDKKSEGDKKNKKDKQGDTEAGDKMAAAPAGDVQPAAASKPAADTNAKSKTSPSKTSVRSVCHCEDDRDLTLLPLAEPALKCAAFNILILANQVASKSASVDEVANEHTVTVEVAGIPDPDKSPEESGSDNENPTTPSSVISGGGEHTAAAAQPVGSGISVGKKDVTDILLKILSRYDLVMVHELRGANPYTTLDALIRQINRLDMKDPFTWIESERLNSVTNKNEQFVILYRASRMQVQETYHYEEGKEIFLREPCLVRFTAPKLDVKDFAVTMMHTDFTDLTKEMAAITALKEYAKTNWEIEEFLMAGIFMAQENPEPEVPLENWKKICLRTDRRFMFQQYVAMDPAAAALAFNRVVFSGPVIHKVCIPDTVVCYRFDDDLELEKEDADGISDHYPLEFHIYGHIHREIQENLSLHVAVTILQTCPVDNMAWIREVYKNQDISKPRKGWSIQLLKKDSQIYELRLVQRGIADVPTAMQDLRKNFVGVIDENTVHMTCAIINAGLMTKKVDIYGLIHPDPPIDNIYDITVTIALAEPQSIRLNLVKRVT